MLVNFIYNTIIEMTILVCILIWVLLACTIIIPLLWNLGMGDYFYIKDFIQDMKMNKIK